MKNTKTVNQRVLQKKVTLFKCEKLTRKENVIKVKYKFSVCWFILFFASVFAEFGLCLRPFLLRCVHFSLNQYYNKIFERSGQGIYQSLWEISLHPKRAIFREHLVKSIKSSNKFPYLLLKSIFSILTRIRYK